VNLKAELGIERLHDQINQLRNQELAWILELFQGQKITTSPKSVDS
jgi:hypothetical protein